MDGKDNFAADRQVVGFALQVTPDAPVGARANRAFLRRVVRYLTADAGIGQLVDIGSGLPTQGNMHEVAQDNAPQARVAYVDNDPLVRVHAQALLAKGPGTIFLTADLREPRAILHDPLPEWRPVVQGGARRDATYYGFVGGVARKPL